MISSPVNVERSGKGGKEITMQHKALKGVLAFFGTILAVGAAGLVMVGGVYLVAGRFFGNGLFESWATELMWVLLVLSMPFAILTILRVVIPLHTGSSNEKDH
ncbi:hypothetical protein [Rubrobacter aplysinae]|uniref:hypothetical protein n=1 Tax=Rubrobacter aplysinae TaxID=909625 RepID=UPI001364A44E|nr:hypothetical protein [Rubrobacter aplysinae]